MPVIPSKFGERVAFFKNRIALWTTNAAGIGVSAPEVTALDTKADAAEAAIAAAELARDNAKSATLAARDAIDAMTNAGADLIKKIKAKAAVDGNTVYTLANIPAPATPSPKPAPGKPSDFGVELDGDGSLILTWKCANPVGTSGTMYQVWRSTTGSEGEFLYCGGCGEKRYVDSTVPAGVTAVTYKIQGVRSTAVGMWATFNVLFGTNAAGGGMSVSVEPSPKMAA
jgi:hypothetical protein